MICPEPATPVHEGAADASAGTLRIGTRTETGFADWAEGATVDFVYGPQGGSMLRPNLRLEGTTLTGESHCLRVEVFHTPPGAERAPSFTLFLELYAVDGGYETGPLYDVFYVGTTGDMLGYDAVVRTSRFASEAHVGIVIGNGAWGG
jgi:hypothetical protein